MLNPITIDFETKLIEERPRFPPEPVGVSIMEGSKPEYLAWGHPDGMGNNCTYGQAKARLRSLWRSGRPLLFYNSKFDLEVALEEFDLALPPWHLCHDALFLVYLNDPHQRDMRLKPSAESLLGEPPDEQNELRDWIMANCPEAKGKPKTWKEWGSLIWKAPVPLVGKYANGDTSRTRKLFDLLFPRIQEAGMDVAYARELQLVPILMRNEREGVRCDHKALQTDVANYNKQFEAADNWVRKKLKAPSLDLDKNDELADALENAGLVAPDDWLRTPKGARSTSKESLRQAIKDPALMAVMEYRATLATCLRTFLRPWLRTADQSGGVIYFNWNQTRNPDDEGTRTGRLSSSPNGQNIPTDENIEKAEKNMSSVKGEWMPLPHVRRYIVADSPQHVLLDRDFSQQELRVLAHFEYAGMMDIYHDDPRVDLHDYASKLITQHTGLQLSRKVVKTIAFGLMYGMGVPKLAAKLDVSIEEAKAAKNAYLNTFPGVKELMKELNYRGKTGDHMTTWGGRRYYAEEPRRVGNKMLTFEYKLLNYLIQGSSADITKEAIIRYDATRRDSRLILTVHDEIMTCAPKRVWKSEMAVLREAMNGVELAVPLLSDGEYGYRWFEMEACD